MRYLKKFNTLNEYTAVKDNLILPCTSLITEDYSVKFDAWKDTRLDEYFTIESLEDGNEIIYNKVIGAENSNYNLYYSLDNGVTWNYKTQDTSPLVTLNTGERVLLYHVGNYNSNQCFIKPSKTFNVRGNIMSMVWGQDFKGKTEFKSTQYNCRFNNFFAQSKVVSAKDLMLPTTTLADYCYKCMFLNCTSLTTAPELPATTLAENCYYQMFAGCTALITAPELPATILARNCYNHMFDGCTSLTTATEILPATTLEDDCYLGMFCGCTSLTTAPELPATTLAENCYSQMFNGCTNLNYIKCLATDISAYDCTHNWVYNVAATGIFVKADNMSSWSTGNSGIPSGWTVEDYTEE